MPARKASATALMLWVLSAPGIQAQVAARMAGMSRPQMVSRGPENVADFGATGDGATDDTAAIQNALNSAGAARNATFFPCGVYLVTQPLQASGPVQLDDCATLRATAPMSAVIEIGQAGTVEDGTFRGGVIDANDLAQDGIVLQGFDGSRISDTEVLNAPANGFHLTSGRQATLARVHTRRTAGTLRAGSTGLLIEAEASGINVTASIFVGSDTGIRTLSGGNFFTDIHVWSPPSAGTMSIGFDDYGSGNVWKGCEPDTAQLYGMRVRQTMTVVEGCRFYNGVYGGQDGVAIGLYFDSPQPNATVSANIFFGQDPSHRLLQDIHVSAPAALKLFGNQFNNVVQHIAAASF